MARGGGWAALGLGRSSAPDMGGQPRLFSGGSSQGLGNLCLEHPCTQLPGQGLCQPLCVPWGRSGLAASAKSVPILHSSLGRKQVREDAALRASTTHSGSLWEVGRVPPFHPVLPHTLCPQPSGVMGSLEPSSARDTCSGQDPGMWGVLTAHGWPLSEGLWLADGPGDRSA